MAKLVWDATGSRFWEAGDDHMVLYPQAVDGTYPEGVAWNGITAVTASPGGAEATDLWADNIKYATLRSAETYGGTIEAYTYPDEFMECDGSAEIVDGVTIGQQARKAFGYCYRTRIGSDTDPSADNGYILHLVYNATASPSEKSYQTINDSPEAITFSWEIQTTPISAGDNYKPCASIDINSLKVDAEKLTAIENALYGTDASGGSQAITAHLPLPLAVINFLNGTSDSL